MFELTRQLTINLFNRKSIQVVWLLSIIGLGIFTALTYQSFLYLQSQNISQLSLYNEVIKPLVGLTLVFQVLFMCLAASSLTPYLASRGQLGIILHSGLSDLTIFLSLYFVILISGLFPLINFVVITLFYFNISEMDFALVVSSIAALTASLLLYSGLILALAMKVKNTILAMLVTLFGVVVFILADELLRITPSLNNYALALDLILQLRAGLIVPSSIASWLLWWIVLLLAGLAVLQSIRLRANKPLRVAILLLAVGIFLNGWFKPAASINSVDVSIEHLNSLAPEKAKLIADIEQPIQISAVIDDEQKHDEIRQAFNILQQYHSAIELKFTNRQALGAKSEFVDQFVTVQIGELQQSLRFPFDRSAKQALSELIIQLSTRANQWILFVEGHGEASPFGQSNRALSSFYQSLKSLGWPVAMQNFAKQPMVSKNTKLLILAASRQQWLPKEIALLQDYLEQGGNLLLLREAGDKVPLAIQQYLGVGLVKGTLIDWLGYQSGTPHPAILIVNEFEQHPINTGVESLLAFPWSNGLLVPPQESSPRFEILPVLKTHSGVWSEFNDDQPQLAFNPEQGELRQAFNLAVALKNKTSQQRIAVVGDSSFLSDSAINNYNNRQFALNLVAWLSSQSITQSNEQYRDNYIKATPLVHWLLLWGFSLVLPLSIGLIMLVFRIIKRPSKIRATEQSESS